jgi:high affinity sulfate transporter 1
MRLKPITGSAASPILGWLFQYQKQWVRFDVVAGLTAAAVVIPKAMAYATIARVPVEVGLYTAFVPMAIYALLGTSRPLSVSTTSTLALLTGTQLARVVSGGGPERLMSAAAALALLTGGFLVLAAILRLGFVANFISDPVLTGFKAGIGLVIVVDQLPKILGIHFAKGGFFTNLLSIGRHLPASSVPTLILAFATLAIVILVEKFFHRIPAPLLAVVAGIAASALLGLERIGVETVGGIPSGFPAFTVPDFSLARELWPAAAGIALMSFTETVAAGRAFVRQGEPRPETNRELLALGLANIGGGFFRAMPAGGGTSQTAVNRRAGARSQMSALVTVAVVAAGMLFLAPVISLMPQATLAAVVVATTVGLISPAEFLAIRVIRPVEFRWALVALAGVVVLGSLQGIVVAVIVSLLAVIYQANHPPVYILGRKPGTNVFRPRSAEHPEDETFDGLLIVRTEGRIHFANAQRVGDKVWPLIHEAKARVVLLDCSAIPDIEYTALKMLTEAEAKFRQAGITLWLAALNPEVLRVLQRSTLWKTLGRERLFFNVEQAAAAYQANNARGGPGMTP